MSNFQKSTAKFLILISEIVLWTGGDKFTNQDLVQAKGENQIN